MSELSSGPSTSEKSNMEQSATYPEIDYDLLEQYISSPSQSSEIERIKEELEREIEYMMRHSHVKKNDMIENMTVEQFPMSQFDETSSNFIKDCQGVTEPGIRMN